MVLRSGKVRKAEVIRHSSAARWWGCTSRAARELDHSWRQRTRPSRSAASCVSCQDVSPCYLLCPRKEGQERGTEPAALQVSCRQSSCLDLAPSRTGFVWFVDFGGAVHFQKRTLNLGLRIMKARRNTQEPECALQSKLSVKHGRTFASDLCVPFLGEKDMKDIRPCT